MTRFKSVGIFILIYVGIVAIIFLFHLPYSKQIEYSELLGLLMIVISSTYFLFSHSNIPKETLKNHYKTLANGAFTKMRDAKVVISSRHSFDFPEDETISKIPLFLEIQDPKIDVKMYAMARRHLTWPT